MKHIDYVNKLNKYDGNQASSSTSASRIKALPTSRVLYDNLENLFYVEHEIKHLFPIQPPFSDIQKLMKPPGNFRNTGFQNKNGGKTCWKFCEAILIKR